MRCILIGFIVAYTILNYVVHTIIINPTLEHFQLFVIQWIFRFVICLNTHTEHIENMRWCCIAHGLQCVYRLDPIVVDAADRRVVHFDKMRKLKRKSHKVFFTRHLFLSIFHPLFLNFYRSFCVNIGKKGKEICIEMYFKREQMEKEKK